MNYKQLILLLIAAILGSCQSEKTLTRIEGKRIEINDSLATRKDIDSFVSPYRNHVNKSLDSTLAYSAGTFSKTDGELNTAIGNMLADLVYELTNPIYQSRTGQEIDMVLLNHGGIRAPLPEGPVSMRNAYEIMPFENSIVVVEMNAKAIDSLISYLCLARRAHPISQLQLVLNADYIPVEVNIKGKPINRNKTYHVATNDYLYYGGDRMDFYKMGDSMHVMDYKIRNAIIDFFTKHDTINPVPDDRFIIRNE